MVPSKEKAEYGRLLKSLPPNELQAILSQLSEKEAMEIFYDWQIWARDSQIVRDYDEGWPEPIVLYMLGRGAGKTRLASEWIRSKAKQYPGCRIAVVGPTAADTRDVLVHGPSGIIAVHPPHEAPEHQPTYGTLTWPNGTQAKLYSAEKGDRLRGGNNMFLWIDEVGSIVDKDVFDQAMLALRVGESRALLTTTPRKGNEILLDLYKRAVFNNDPPQEGKDVRIITGSTYENLENLSDTYRKQIVGMYEGTRLGMQELQGIMLFDSEGALWDTELLEKQRTTNVPDMVAYAIGVDPAVSKNKGSDKTGIVLAGVGDDGFCYVLEDLTGSYSTKEWCSRVVALYDQCDKPCVIVVERNNGGDAIMNSLEQHRPHLPYKSVFSTTDKITRATPVSMLYEQGRVFHTKVFSDLESEMCFYDGRGKSPDRLDAMVFAVTQLMIKKSGKTVIKGF